MAPDSTSTNDATQLEPTPATEPKATPGMALAQAAPECHADGTGTPSDAEGSEIIPESEAPPAKPPRVPLILTSVNGPLRDVFDDVDPQTPEPEDDDLAALKTYVLCFVERSGSTMLTDLMTKAGVLGRPEEYVNPRGPMVYLLREYPATELRHYFTKLRRNRKGNNNVFGMKTIYDDFEPLINAKMVGQLLGAPKFIFLTRKDVVLQAISSHIARHKGLWHSSDRHLKANQGRDFDSVEIPFERDAILELVDRFVSDRLRWEKFFALYGIEPLRLEYESLTPDKMESVLEQICAFIGVKPNFPREKLVTQLEILRDDRSMEWAEKIRAEFQLYAAATQRSGKKRAGDSHRRPFVLLRTISPSARSRGRCRRTSAPRRPCRRRTGGSCRSAACRCRP
jgi:LPS sulfotransferase NodH